MNERADTIACRPIGVIHSPFVDVVGMPIQTAGAPDALGRLEVFPAFVAGLRDIEGFDYLILLTHLHLAQDRLVQRPGGRIAHRSLRRPHALTRIPAGQIALPEAIRRLSTSEMSWASVADRR